MANQPTYLRQDQAAIFVPKLPVKLPFASQSWASLEGGDLESEDTKTRPGGMVGQVNLGGPTSRTDATVMRPYLKELHPFIVKLEESIGLGEMHITYTVLDAKGKVIGPTVTLKGILKSVIRPNFDSNATGTAMLSLVMGCDAASSIS